MGTDERTDAQLAVAASSGDDTALRLLFARYVRQVHSYIVPFVRSSDDADDIAQQTFVNAWKNLRRYDPNRKFSTWLFAIAHNESVNWLRKKRPESLTEGHEESLRDDAPLPDEVAVRAELVRAAERGMMRLSPAAQTVITLRHDGLSFKDIAERLGEPLDTVKSRYRRALATLRDILAAS
ncbi:MAG TPA: sigma-70 family RNA polymerase sigma factor [Candidatus Paceibacterota bacterium]|nr:sigma-70 family RNA polymerase sigma factor [Candidatus Paceibacterota bacterium]